LGSIAEGAVGQQLDLQAVQLGQYKVAEAPIQLATERIQLQRDQLQLQRELTLAQLMAQGSRYAPGGAEQEGAFGGVGGLAGNLMQIANWEVMAGMPDQAAKTATSAARLMDASSRTDYRNYRVQTEQISRFTNMLDTVSNDEAGWSQIVTEMGRDPAMARNPKFQQLARTPYDPTLFDRLKAGAATLREQAEINYRLAATRNQTALADLAPLNRQLKESQIRANDALARKRDGSGVTPVKADDRKAIAELSMSDFPGTMPGTREQVDRRVAEDMVRLLRSNPNITQSEAAHEAYARDKYMYIGLPMMPKTPGTRPELALDAPAREKGQTPEQWLGSLEQGQWYKFPADPRDPKSPLIPRVVIGNKAYSLDELRENRRLQREAMGMGGEPGSLPGEEDEDLSGDEDEGLE
jgi:hypothetical protein